MAREKAVLLVVVVISSSNALALGETRPAGQREEIKRLIKQLADRGTWQRAVDELADIGEPATGPLVELLNRKNVPHWTIHARCIKVLAGVGSPRATDAIVGALENKELNEYVRASAVVALGDVQPDAALRILSNGVRDESRMVRWKSAQALGTLGDAAGLGALATALKDPDQYVRAAAARSLGQIKSPETIGALASALGDESWVVRLNAREALLEAGPPAVDKLLPGLKNRDPQIRWQTAWALGQLRAEGSVEPLVGLLAGDDWMASEEAAVALARIRSDKGIELLEEAQKHESDHVRRQATWVLGQMRKEMPGAAKEVPGASRPAPRQVRCGGKTYPCYPETLDAKPELPSPYVTPEGVELITTMTKEGKFTVMAVTVENGKPLNYKQRQMGRGRQLAVDAADFPTLARTGLHATTELDETKTITGRSIVEITELGRPERSSGAGFMAADEDIISVLKGDNDFVKRLGLTHRQTAKPLFHVWNLMLNEIEQKVQNDAERILYNGREVNLEWIGTKGWQESLFEDEILGMYQFEVSRAPDAKERAFLHTKYPHLGKSQMAALIEGLSHFHTGEMVPYYIRRYGFYEGHTDYRADPIAITFIFGLQSLQEIESAFPGRLDRILTNHFTRDEKRWN